MMGERAGDTTIALPVGGDFAIGQVVDAISREYLDITIVHADAAIRLSSPKHSDDFLTALWWSTAANQALLARAADFRPRLMDYLLS